MLMLGLLASASASQASGSSATDALDRDLEPVIVQGVFPGVPVDQLFVYREINGNWEQIPFQVDEVTASGDYTDTEDSLMDANDEVVFMASDLGDKATTSITATLPISHVWYRIEVTDPLSPTKSGWAYIVRSSTLSFTHSTDYVDYIAASQSVSATNYSMGWATSHGGVDYMSLFGSGDILDRTKLRIRLRVWPFPPSTLTEDDFPPPALVLIKDVPVRAIVSRGTATPFAYASLLQTITPVNLTSLPSNVRIDEIRISTDLTSTITNGTFYNENTPDGVNIDGVEDAVPPTPFVYAWRQISLDSGSIIQVADVGTSGGTLSHYYKDNATPDSTDTGDGMSYGDSGIKITSPTSRLFTLTSVQYILPGRQSNRGAEFYEIFQNPLRVTSHLEFAQKTYLPVMLREG